MTIIQPLIEAGLGIDLITRVPLSDGEIGMKLVFATVDVITLGQAWSMTKGLELGSKELLIMLGKATERKKTSLPFRQKAALSFFLFPQTE